MSAVVIGVGNRFRGDDGVGPAVADKLAALELPGVTVVESDGEPTGLMAAWDGATVAVIIDAVRTGAAPAGTVRRVDALSNQAGKGGTHGLGVGDAWDLGAALGRLPRALVVYGIEAATFALGTGLSHQVAAAVDEVVAAVSAEIIRDVLGTG